MKKNVLSAFGFDLLYAKKAVEDVPDEKMCEQPGGMKNHPAWVLGHLALSCDGACKMLGHDEPKAPAQWGEVFKNGVTPTADRSKYPDKAALVKALEEGHAALAKVYEDAPESVLNQPLPMEEVRPMFPTVGDFVLFLMTGHEGMHLGQVMAWRSAQGMASAFGM